MNLNVAPETLSTEALVDFTRELCALPARCVHRDNVLMVQALIEHCTAEIVWRTLTGAGPRPAEDDWAREIRWTVAEDVR